MEPPITTGSFGFVRVAFVSFVVLMSNPPLPEAEPFISVAIFAATSALFLIRAISYNFGSGIIFSQTSNVTHHLENIFRKRILVVKLFPCVIFEMASKRKGVASFPLMPAASARSSASVIASSISLSECNMLRELHGLHLEQTELTIHSEFLRHCHRNQNA